MMEPSRGGANGSNGSLSSNGRGDGAAAASVEEQETSIAPPKSAGRSKRKRQPSQKIRDNNDNNAAERPSKVARIVGRNVQDQIRNTNFRSTASINKHIPPHKSKGQFNCPYSYYGRASTEEGKFEYVRQWRNLSHNQQLEYLQPRWEKAAANRRAAAAATTRAITSTTSTTTAKRKRKSKEQPWEKEYKKAKKHTEHTDPDFAGWNPLPAHQRKEDQLDKAFRGQECVEFVKECKRENAKDKRNATKRKKRQEQTKVCCKLYVVYYILCNVYHYFTHQLYVLYLRKSVVCLLMEKRLLMLLLLPLLWQLLDDVVPQILLLKYITYKVGM